MRVSYLTAATLDLNRTPLPQCEGVDGFDCCDPAIVFNVDARCYFCGPHHRFWEKHYQSHDPYEFGTLGVADVQHYIAGEDAFHPTDSVLCGLRGSNGNRSGADIHSTNRNPCGPESSEITAPQTLVEWVCEYMQKRGF